MTEMFTSSREEMDYRINQAKQGVDTALDRLGNDPYGLLREAFHGVFKAIQEVADHAATRD